MNENNAKPLTGDEIRAAIRHAHNMSGPSDATQPAEYVLAGALALLSKLRAPVAGEAPTGNHHTLKTDPEVFQAVMTGAKTFEIRLNDRGFQVGDALRLRETRFTGAEMHEGKPLEYTGRECHRIVSHVLTGYGLTEDWCCLSFAAPQASEAVRDALIPFAAMEDADLIGTAYEGKGDDAEILHFHRTGKSVTLGDFRRARAALSAQPGAQRTGGSE